MKKSSIVMLVMAVFWGGEALANHHGAHKHGTTGKGRRVASSDAENRRTHGTESRRTRRGKARKTARGEARGVGREAASERAGGGSEQGHH